MREFLLKLLLQFRGDKDPGPTEQRVGSWMLRHLPGMLTCPEFEEFIHDYYEGLLSAKVRRRFETHMQLCPMCQVHFDSYVRAIALGRQVCSDDEQLPEGMPQELVAAILLARNQDLDS